MNGAGSASTPGVPQPSLTVAAVARRLGVAPATLRTWDRRYGLGPSEHAAGAHRRYSPQDFARLTVMRRLTLQGVTPAEAARAALAADDAVLRDALPSAPPPPGGPPAPERPEPGSEPVPPGIARHGGGRVLALPAAAPATRGLARAALALDSRACTELVRVALVARGTAETWEGLVRPVLVAIGERYAATGEGVDVEHLLSDSVAVALREVTATLFAPRNARPVLLAAAEEEQHVLPLYALAAALAEEGVASRVLGARVPPDALASAVRRTGPAAVLVYSHLRETGAGAQLAGLPPLRPAPTLLAAGPGWEPATLPAAVAAVDDLATAVELVCGAACG